LEPNREYDAPSARRAFHPGTNVSTRQRPTPSWCISGGTLTRALSNARCAAFNLVGRSASSNPAMPSSLYHVPPNPVPQVLSVHPSYLDLRIYDGTLDRIHRVPYEQCHEQAGCNTEPPIAIVDSQSVKSAGKEGRTAIRTGHRGQAH
jgi:hypothetical protein